MPKYKFIDIAFNSTEKKKPTEADKDTYLGLEHLDSGCLTVKRFGTEVAPVGEKLLMKKGDVLFGKRRAYQKKVAIAPFDGIFSAHGMVLRPKENVISKEFFPLFISSDYFLEAAIAISVGSLSPTINWKDLKELEFDIPSLEDQAVIAPIIWAAISAKESYEELLMKCDDLVKSQFIEMFGDQKTNPLGFNKMTLESTCTFFSGTGFPNNYQGCCTGKYPFYKVGDISRNVQEGNIFLVSCDNYVSDEVAKELRGVILPDKTVVFAKIGEALRLNRRAITSKPCLIDNNAMGIKPNEDYLDLEYFYQYMLTLDLSEYSAATAMPSVKKSTLQSIKIIVPPRELQRDFSRLRQQLDKSKFVLRICLYFVEMIISHIKNSLFRRVSYV